ncbi:hypothetical protein NGRA_0965 [Nosema granulosis]|uniref:ISXO2-like transposase domain-containing protein n=1 Tax=Nosema granulosis TaxID=83296 RepID=A0A9P6KZM4_9MICR|nr:hypothetical protein NGRA_0965 [Nosema granulosis]
MVQLDETEMYNGMIITNPSSAYDGIPNVQWLRGGVVEGNCRSFFMESVSNRRAATIEDVLRRHVCPGTIYITDRFASYHSAVRNFGCIHEVVNHSVELVNQDGSQTNQLKIFGRILSKNIEADQD